MNKVELFVHNLIGQYPWLRVPVVNLYQRIFSLFHQVDRLEYEILIKEGYFFGFHDKCPWSYDGNYHLAHKFNMALDMKQNEMLPIEYGVFEGKNLDNFRLLGNTVTWNWQQGANLQWLGKKNILLVNSLDDDLPCAIMQSVDGEVLNIIDYHLASIDPQGHYGLSYCFGRLGCGAKGYGYPLWRITNSTTNDSLRLIEFESGSKKELVNLIDLTSIDHTKSMDGAYHFFSHGLFSHAGDRILFFHQWRQKSGVLNSRLYSIGCNGERLYCFPGKEFSHIAWRGTNEVLAYCNIHDNHWGYYICKDQEGSWCPVGDKYFSSDGHPNCTRDGRAFVTDTYPDRNRQQRLFVFDFSLDEAKEIANLSIPFLYRGVRRCDFHPRWNHQGRQLSFDSAHTGVRSFCIMNIEKSYPKDLH